MAIDPLSIDPGLDFNMGASQEEGLMQLAEFKKNKFADFIEGQLGVIPKAGFKRKRSTQTLTGEGINTNLIKQALEQLKKDEATDEWGLGYKGDVSDELMEFLQENKPETPQEKIYLKQMLDGLPSNVLENLKEKMPNLRLDERNNWYTISQADMPGEELMQLAKGVTFRNPLKEKWKEGIKKHNELGWDEGVKPIIGDFTRDEYDLQLRKSTLNDDGQWLYEKAIKEGHDPEKVMNILQRKYTDDQRKKAVKQKYGVVFHSPETQISSAQYLIDQARKGEGATDTFLDSGVQVASAGDLRGSGIPEIIERKRQAAIRKQAAESMAQAGVDLSGRRTVTPTIKTTAPGQAGGYQHQGEREAQQQAREQERQDAVERTSSRVSPSGKVMAYGLQEGGMVDQRVQDLGQNAGILGLSSLFGQGGPQQPYQGGQNPFIQTVGGGGRQQPPQGGWPPRNIQDILGGGPRNWPPRGGTQMAIHQFGEQLGGFGETLGGYGETIGGYEEQLGGFGETLGGYGEQIGGFGEQMSGVEEAMGGFSGQFDNLNNRLDSMEKGIASLSDQMQPKQPQFGGYGGYGGMGGYGGYGGGFGYRGRFG